MRPSVESLATQLPPSMLISVKIQTMAMQVKPAATGLLRIGKKTERYETAVMPIARLPIQLAW